MLLLLQNKPLSGESTVSPAMMVLVRRLFDACGLLITAKAKRNEKKQTTALSVRPLLLKQSFDNANAETGFTAGEESNFR